MYTDQKTVTSSRPDLPGRDIRARREASPAVVGGVPLTMGRLGARRALAPNAFSGIRTTRGATVWYEMRAQTAP